MEKSRPLLTQKERLLIDSHPTLGKEFLESLESIPPEVIDIAHQHHENCLGQGLPQKLQKSKIHPLAKVVHVANIFCEYAIKYRSDIMPISAEAAIKAMEKDHREEIDREAFNALKQLFKM